MKRTKHHESWLKESSRLQGDLLAGMLAHTPITPTQVTVFRFLCVLLASVLIALDKGYYSLLLSAFCLYLFAMLDAVDGSLATMQDSRSKTGAWLDREADGLGFFFVFLGISVRFTQGSVGESYWVMLPFACLSMAFMVKITRLALTYNHRFKELSIYRKKKNAGQSGATNRSEPKWQLKRQLGPSYLKITTILILGLVLNQIEYALVVLFSFFFLWWVYKTVQIYRWAYMYDQDHSS